MMAEIAPGADIKEVRSIGGGLASETYAVNDFVVKLFRPHRRAEAPLEWDRLNFVQRVADVPVPEPIALDADERWFGAPALVMTRMPGRGNIKPDDVDGWLRQLAHSLAAIHETNTVGADGALLGDPPLGHWGIGDWERLEYESTPLVGRCVEAIRRCRLSFDNTPVLVHGDFHPGNIVWRNGALTGVVDWSAARVGSRWFEFAQCRAGIALLFGVYGVRRLTEHYLDVAGPTPVDLPVFDLMSGLVARQLGPTRWLPSYQQQGCTDTSAQLAARVTPFLRQALAALGG